MIRLHLDDDRHEGMVLLHGKWWSPEDAAYAKELEVSDLSTPEIVRLWAENRPSVRKTVNGSPVAEIGGPERLKTPEDGGRKTPEDGGGRLKALRRRERNSRYHERRKASAAAHQSTSDK
jgi:hypothetical protein